MTTTTTTVVACTLNSRLLSGHLGVITVGDFFFSSTMVRWVDNSRDPVLCARVLLLRNVQKNLNTNCLTSYWYSRVCFLILVQAYDVSIQYSSSSTNILYLKYSIS